MSLIDDYVLHARKILADYQHQPLALQEGYRDAAVLVLVYHLDGQERVLLTERTHKVEHHKGQVSFPGGAWDGEHEDLATTALREAWEEVGVDPDHVELIGRLDDMFTISNFRVAPFVGVLSHAPYPFIPAPLEVERVLEVPIRHLLDPGQLVRESRSGADGRPLLLADGSVATMPAWWWDGARIWGATARMLEGFLQLLAAPPRR